MIKQEIIENAPDGATHYTSTPMEIIYLKYHGGIWWCFFFGEWRGYELELNETPMPL